MTTKYVVKSSSLTLNDKDHTVKQRGDVIELDADSPEATRYLGLDAIEIESDATDESAAADEAPADQPAPTGRRARATKE